MDNLETQATLGTKTKGQSSMHNLETQATLGTKTKGQSRMHNLETQATLGTKTNTKHIRTRTPQNTGDEPR
jgi:hypothetical protein